MDDLQNTPNQPLATERAFGVNTEALAPQQAALFNFLNPILTKLEITPQEFDQQFRREVLLSIIMVMMQYNSAGQGQVHVNEANILSSSSSVEFRSESVTQAALHIIMLDPLFGTLSAPDNFRYRFEGSDRADTFIRHLQTQLPIVFRGTFSATSSPVFPNYKGNPSDQAAFLPDDIVLQKYSSGAIDFRQNLENANRLDQFRTIDALDKYAKQIFSFSLFKTLGRIATAKNISIKDDLQDETQLRSMISALVDKQVVPNKAEQKAPENQGPLWAKPHIASSNALAWMYHGNETSMVPIDVASGKDGIITAIFEPEDLVTLESFKKAITTKLENYPPGSAREDGRTPYKVLTELRDNAEAMYNGVSHALSSMSTTPPDEHAAETTRDFLERYEKWPESLKISAHYHPVIYIYRQHDMAWGENNLTPIRYKAKEHERKEFDLRNRYNTMLTIRSYWDIQPIEHYMDALLELRAEANAKGVVFSSETAFFLEIYEGKLSRKKFPRIARLLETQESDIEAYAERLRQGLHFPAKRNQQELNIERQGPNAIPTTIEPTLRVLFASLPEEEQELINYRGIRYIFDNTAPHFFIANNETRQITCGPTIGDILRHEPKKRSGYLREFRHISLLCAIGKENVAADWEPAIRKYETIVTQKTKDKLGSITPGLLMAFAEGNFPSPTQSLKDTTMPVWTAYKTALANAIENMRQEKGIDLSTLSITNRSDQDSPWAKPNIVPSNAIVLFDYGNGSAALMEIKTAFSKNGKILMVLEPKDVLTLESFKEALIAKQKDHEYWTSKEENYHPHVILEHLIGRAEEVYANKDLTKEMVVLDKPIESPEHETAAIQKFLKNYADWPEGLKIFAHHYPMFFVFHSEKLMAGGSNIIPFYYKEKEFEQKKSDLQMRYNIMTIVRRPWLMAESYMGALAEYKIANNKTVEQGTGWLSETAFYEAVYNGTFARKKFRNIAKFTEAQEADIESYANRLQKGTLPPLSEINQDNLKIEKTGEYAVPSEMRASLRTFFANLPLEEQELINHRGVSYGFENTKHMGAQFSANRVIFSSEIETALSTYEERKLSEIINLFHYNSLLCAIGIENMHVNLEQITEICARSFTDPELANNFSPALMLSMYDLGFPGETRKLKETVMPAWEAFQAARTQALEDMREEKRTISAAKYPATDKAFGVNTELLTGPQTALFNYINERLVKLDVTPQVFDQQFRRELIISYIVQNKKDAQDSKPSDTSLTPVQRANIAMQRVIMDPLYGTLNVPDHFPYEDYITRLHDAMVTEFLKSESQYTSATVDHLRKHLEKKDKLAALILEKTQEHGSVFAAGICMLQEYSSGNISLVERARWVAKRTSEFNHGYSAIKDCTEIVLERAIDAIASAKAITLEGDETTRTDRIRELVNEAFKSHQQIEREEERRKLTVSKVKEPKPSLETPEKDEEPKPYPLPLLNGKYRQQAEQDFGELCKLLDCRDAENKALGDRLFPTEIKNLLDAFYGRRMGQLKSLMDSSKNRQNSTAIKGIRTEVETLLFADNANHTAIVEAITHCAPFVGLLTAKYAHMQELDKTEEPQYYLRETILPELFPDRFKPTAVATTVQEDLALLEELTRPEPKMVEPPIPEIITKKEEELPSPPIAAPVIVPEPQPKPEPIEVMPPTPPVKKIPELFRSNIYAPPTRLSNEELWALLEDKLADAQMTALGYADRDPAFNQHYCEIDIKTDPYQLRHIFARDGDSQKGEPSSVKEEWRQSLGTNNLDAAVDMKIAIQADILNDNFFSPLRQGKRNGGPINILGTESIPLMAPETVHVSRSGGACYLNFDAHDRKNGPLLHFSMPLGIIDRPHTLTEVERRRDIVMQEIDRARASRVYLAKDALIEHLKNYIIKNSPNNSLDWFAPERIDLPNYERSTLINKNEDQRVALGAVTLHYDASIDAPSWIADFRFHLQTDPESKDLGPVVRTHHMRLHSYNEDLAIERATFAAKQLHQMVGSQHRQAAWSVEGDEKKDLVLQDAVRLERIFQEMRRYEDDVGCRLSNQTETGNDIEFTVKAMRCWGVSIAKKDPSILEPIDIAKVAQVGSEAEPVEMTLRVPKTSIALIEVFVGQVHNTFSIKLGEEYASIALKNEGEHKPKTPKKYLRITAPEMLVEACLNHTSIFPEFKIIRHPERCKHLLSALSTAQGGSGGIKDVSNEHSRRRDQSEGIA